MCKRYGIYSVGLFRDLYKDCYDTVAIHTKSNTTPLYRYVTRSTGLLGAITGTM
jgi:hypothetical protein